jgi:hypothetical protein
MSWLQLVPQHVVESDWVGIVFRTSSFLSSNFNGRRFSAGASALAYLAGVDKVVVVDDRAATLRVPLQTSFSAQLASGVSPVQTMAQGA